MKCASASIGTKRGVLAPQKRRVASLSSASLRAQERRITTSTQAAQAKELYCVKRETSTDGSTLFKFSEDKPAAEPVAEETAAAPVVAEEPVTKEEPAETMPPVDKSNVQPAVIIGGGRVGQALVEMGTGTDLLLKRGDKFPADLKGEMPIIVCTRNDVLDDVVFSIPPGRWADLVFLQNGVLEPWLVKQGLQKSTQMLAYFAVAKLGDPVTDGKTELNPEGLTSITGKWAAEVAERLHASNLSCHVLNKADYDVKMYEKLIWISSFMVVGATHGCTVGEVCDKHKSELSEIIGELAGIVTAFDGTESPPGLVERLVAYGRSVAHFPTAVKEFEWRNGFFYNISKKATDSGAEDPAPLHTKMLANLNALP